MRAVVAHRFTPSAHDGAAGSGQRDHRFYNIARRTFLTYRLAMPNASYAQVSREAGNSESVLRKYYDRRATRKEATLYFLLAPENV